MPDATPTVDSGMQQELPDAGDPPDAGPVDGGQPCEGDNSCRVTWAASAEFPSDIDHHSTFIATSAAGAFLYAAGGVQNHDDTLDAIWSNVRRAKLNDDGSLGAWTDCAPLPLPMGFQAVGQHGKFVYLMAGLSEDAQGPYAVNRTLVGTVGDDGDISWKDGSKPGVAALHGTAAVLGNRLYLIGGTGQGNAPQSVVRSALLYEDGTMGAWEMSVPLPLQRSHHVAFVHGERIYVAGGFDTGNVPHDAVLRSEHDASGALTGWQNIGDGLLESSPWTSGVALLNDHVMLVGGGEGGPGATKFVDRVRMARILPDGTLTKFLDVDSPLPMARAHVHQAPVWKGHIYSVGGRQYSRLKSMRTVQVGTLGFAP